jgi:hypothetical protein
VADRPDHRTVLRVVAVLREIRAGVSLDPHRLGSGLEFFPGRVPCSVFVDAGRLRRDRLRRDRLRCDRLRAQAAGLLADGRDQGPVPAARPPALEHGQRRGVVGGGGRGGGLNSPGVSGEWVQQCMHDALLVEAEGL